MKQELQEIQVACLRMGEGLYAVDIMRIKEIINPLQVTAVPKAPSFIRKSAISGTG